MSEVDAELYDFLKENECHLFRRENEVIGWVCVHFYDINEFQSAVGSSCFDDCEMEVTLCNGYIAVELNDIIELMGHELKDYRKCFGAYEQEEYFGKGATG